LYSIHNIFFSRRERCLRERHGPQGRAAGWLAGCCSGWLLLLWLAGWLLLGE